MCVCIVFGMFMYVLMVYPVISQAHVGHNEYKNYLDGSQNRKTHQPKAIIVDTLPPVPKLNPVPRLTLEF